ncbi:bifunctional phosphopantothenoylcysteine decarboxylase/phosphopantothenate--cysteine ligase CoaBC [Candidatus Bathyarchaeota archaeon]|nr:bifunctional phosphopantothenoylcysteine decarboxylase/phosphopantothenate--cysteine ligase CoaBC [Candidatus Bathyarchaeota archaeon]
MGSLGRELTGRKITLCITGSVAAVQAPEIARELMRRGADVYPVLSKSASELVSPKLMEWATGNRAVVELTGQAEHIQLAGEWPERSDLVLIAPATANTIGKIASGIDDTNVTTVATTALGTGVPIIVAPAMHYSMYRHPVVLENISKLRSLGIEVLDPQIVEGKAKVIQTSEIVEAVMKKLQRKDLEGTSFLVTAGPTLEYIDPVRVITNRSSGRMGVAIAREAARRGAETTLILGPAEAEPPTGIRTIRIETSEQMLEAVRRELEGERYDVFVACAAVADYRPTSPYKTKIRTVEAPVIEIKLQATPKIIDLVKKISPETRLVAFKADYGLSNEELIQRSRQILDSSGADLVVANHVGVGGVGFGSEENEVFLIDRRGSVTHIERARKEAVAGHLVDYIVDHLRLKGP